MKKYYVYELVNLMGTVEYVGETTNPKSRFSNHKTKSNKVRGGGGKFKNRADIFFNIVKEFDTKEEAYDYQCKLQKEYGFETDLEKMKSRIKMYNILQNSGENNYLSKLTSEQVSDIRNSYIPYNKQYNGVMLAKKYNVSPQTINYIVNNKKYK